jgi:hypothetical protein
MMTASLDESLHQASLSRGPRFVSFIRLFCGLAYPHGVAS